MEDILEKICQCAICLEVLRNPKTLVCQHTFCEICLESACVKNKNGRWHLTCPTCRSKQPFVTQKKDVSFIGTSQIVKEITELLRSKISGKKKILNDETNGQLEKEAKFDISESPGSSLYYVETNHVTLSSNFSSQISDRISKTNTYDLVSGFEKTKRDLEIYIEKYKKQEIDLRRLKNVNMMLLIDNTLLKMKSFESSMDSQANVFKKRDMQTTNIVGNSFNIGEPIF